MPTIEKTNKNVKILYMNSQEYREPVVEDKKAEVDEVRVEDNTLVITEISNAIVRDHKLIIGGN